MEAMLCRNVSCQRHEPGDQRSFRTATVYSGEELLEHCPRVPSSASLLLPPHPGSLTVLRRSRILPAEPSSTQTEGHTYLHLCILYSIEPCQVSLKTSQVYIPVIGELKDMTVVLYIWPYWCRQEWGVVLTWHHAVAFMFFCWCCSDTTWWVGFPPSQTHRSDIISGDVSLCSFLYWFLHCSLQSRQSLQCLNKKQIALLSTPVLSDITWSSGVFLLSSLSQLLLSHLFSLCFCTIDPLWGYTVYTSLELCTNTSTSRVFFCLQ